MDRFTGIIGIIVIFGIAYLMSNNKKAINLRLVLSGLGLQILIAVLVLKVPLITSFFAMLGCSDTSPWLTCRIASINASGLESFKW